MSFTLLHPALIAVFSGFTALPQRLVSTVMYISNAMGLQANARGSNQDVAAAVNRLFPRLLRTLGRLNALMIRFKAGHAMQRPAARHPRAPRAPRAPATPAYRLPGDKGWLSRLVPGTNQYSGWFETALDDDLRALAAASPQARRLLRPLWRMMGLTPPAVLDLPPRPARPASPAQPPPEPRDDTPPARPQPARPQPARPHPDLPPPIPPAPD